MGIALDVETDSFHSQIERVLKKKKKLYIWFSALLHFYMMETSLRYEIISIQQVNVKSVTLRIKF